MDDDLTPEQQRRIDALLAPKRTIQVRSASDIEPRRAKFLWMPYFPLGKVVIVAGAPGHGKSQFAALSAGLATRGLLVGDIKEPSRVLMMCAEDDLADTVVPRLMAVNADLQHVDFINVLTEYPDGLTAEGMIRLPGDVKPVHDWARENVTARLVIMDPVASFFERTHSTLVNQDIRDVMGPMVAIAQTYGITIVIILHLNKSESRDFMSRIAESHGFQALARSVLALGPDPDDRDGARGSQKVIAVTKANLVKPGMYGMRCEVRSVTLTHGLREPIETSELVLLGKCEITADDLLMPSAERTERNAKREWLDEFLEGGWRRQEDVKKAAISDGWTWKQIDNFARTRSYQRQKVGFQGKWWIGDPNADPRAIPESTSPLDSMESFGDSKGSKEDKDSKDSGYARGESLNGEDLDEFHRWEQRRLGERDDEDES
jgi:putative DNA primase/helicase